MVVEETLDAANGANGNILIPQLLVGELHNVLLGDAVNGALDLTRVHAAASGDELTANVLGNSGCAVERQQYRGLELSLGALNLGLGYALGKTRPLAEGEVDKVVKGGQLVGDEVDTPETIQVSIFVHSISTNSSNNIPGVAVAGGKAHEAVGQVVLVNETAELAALVRSAAHGLVVVADNSLSNQSGEVVVIVPANTLDSNGNVGGRDGVVTNAQVGSDESGLPLGQEVGGVLGRGHGESREVLLGKVDELLVGDATGTNKDHAVSGIVGLDVVGELGASDVANVLLGAQDGAAQRLVLVGGGVEVVEDNLVELLLNLLGLAQDDIAFPLNGRGLELGVLEDIGQDVDGLGDIGVECPGEVDSVLALHVC